MESAKISLEPRGGPPLIWHTQYLVALSLVSSRQKSSSNTNFLNRTSTSFGAAGQLATKLAIDAASSLFASRIRYVFHMDIFAGPSNTNILWPHAEAFCLDTSREGGSLCAPRHLRRKNCCPLNRTFLLEAYQKYMPVPGHKHIFPFFGLPLNSQPRQAPQTRTIRGLGFGFGEGGALLFSSEQPAACPAALRSLRPNLHLVCNHCK